jgi:hypothetical protein
MKQTINLFITLCFVFCTSNAQISKPIFKYEKGKLNYVFEVERNCITDSCSKSNRSGEEKSSFFGDSDDINYSNNVPSQNLDIYLLIGQSNMAGRAEIESQDKDTLKDVFLFKGTVDIMWERAANPLNKYSTIRKDLSMQKLNPGYTFAHEMAKSSANKIGLIVNARGGTSINLWGPDSELYKEAIMRTKAAVQYGTLKGILWHQGESDAIEYESYLPKLLEIIQSLRSDLGTPNLPFIAGQLSGDKLQRQEFNKIILELPKKIKNTGVVKTDSTNTIDSTHFNSASQRLLGKRYAMEMKKILLNNSSYY